MNSAADILNIALALPADERAVLAQQLIDSLPGQHPPLGASDEDVQQRLDDVAAGRFEAADWREAIANLRAVVPRAERSSS